MKLERAAKLVCPGCKLKLASRSEFKTHTSHCKSLRKKAAAGGHARTSVVKAHKTKHRGPSYFAGRPLPKGRLSLEGLNGYRRCQHCLLYHHWRTKCVGLANGADGAGGAPTSGEGSSLRAGGEANKPPKSALHSGPVLTGCRISSQAGSGPGARSKDPLARAASQQGVGSNLGHPSKRRLLQPRALSKTGANPEVGGVLKGAGGLKRAVDRMRISGRPGEGESVQRYESLSAAANAIGVTKGEMHRAINNGTVVRNSMWMYAEDTRLKRLVPARPGCAPGENTHVMALSVLDNAWWEGVVKTRYHYAGYADLYHIRFFPSATQDKEDEEVVDLASLRCLANEVRCCSLLKCGQAVLALTRQQIWMDATLVRFSTGFQARPCEGARRRGKIGDCTCWVLVRVIPPKIKLLGGAGAGGLEAAEQQGTQQWVQGWRIKLPGASLDAETHAREDVVETSIETGDLQSLPHKLPAWPRPPRAKWSGTASQTGAGCGRKLCQSCGQVRQYLWNDSARHMHARMHRRTLDDSQCVEMSQCVDLTVKCDAHACIADSPLPIKVSSCRCIACPA